MRLAERVEVGALLGDLLARAHRRQPGGAPVVDGVDAAAIVPACAESRPRACELVVAQDAARDRLALDAVHEEAGAEVVGGFEQRTHLRHRHAARRGREHGVLGRPVVGVGLARRVPAQDELVDGPCESVASSAQVSRRAARSTAQAVHLDGPADEASDHTGEGHEIRGFAGHGGDDIGPATGAECGSARRCAYLHEFSTGSCGLLHARSLSLGCERYFPGRPHRSVGGPWGEWLPRSRLAGSP